MANGQTRIPSPLSHFALAADSLSTTDSILTTYGVAAFQAPYPSTVFADTLPPEGGLLALTLHSQIDTTYYKLSSLAPDYAGWTSGDTTYPSVFLLVGNTTLADSLVASYSYDPGRPFVFYCTGKLTIDSTFRVRLLGVLPNDIYFLADSGVEVRAGARMVGTVLSKGDIHLASSLTAACFFTNSSFSYTGSGAARIGIGNPIDLVPAQVPACPAVSLCGNILPNGNFGYAVQPKDIVGYQNIEQTSCWERVPDNWSTLGSPDYYAETATNSALGVPNNGFGTQADASPYSESENQGYAGIGTTAFVRMQFNPNILVQQQYTEYLYQRLRFGSRGTNDLKPNKYYYAGFKASLAERSDHATKLGLHFGFYDEGLGPYPPRADGHIVTIPTVSSASIVTSTSSWTSIGGIYLASGYEKCLLIGRFLTPVTGGSPDLAEDLITVTPASGTPALSSYYYIDDIVIAELPDAGADKTVACGTPVIVGSERTTQACGEYLIPPGSTWVWSVPGLTSLPPGLIDDPHALRPTVTTAEDVTLRFTFTDPHGNSFYDDMEVKVTTGTPFTPHVSVRCGPSNNYLIRMDVAPALVTPKTNLDRYVSGSFTNVANGSVDEFSITSSSLDGTYRITRTYDNGCEAVCTFDMLGLDYSSPKYSGGTFDNDVIVYNDITLLNTVVMNSGIRVFVAGDVETPTLEEGCVPNEKVNTSSIRIGNGSTGTVLKLNGAITFQGICSFWNGFVVKKNGDIDFNNASNIDISDAEVGVHYFNTISNHTIANTDFFNCLTGIECTGSVAGLSVNSITYDLKAASMKAPFDPTRATDYDECYGSLLNPGFTGKAGILWPDMEGDLAVSQSSFQNGVVGIAAIGGNISIDNETRVTGKWHGLLCRPISLYAHSSTFRADYKAGLAQSYGTAQLEENVFGDVSDKAFQLHYSLFDPLYTAGKLLQGSAYWSDLEDMVASFATNRVGAHLIGTTTTVLSANTARNGNLATNLRPATTGYFNTGILLDGCDNLYMTGNTIYNMAVGLRLQGVQPATAKVIQRNGFYTNTKHIYFASGYVRDENAQNMGLNCNVFESQASIKSSGSSDKRYGLFIASGAKVERVGTCDQRSGNAFPGPNLVPLGLTSGSHGHASPYQVNLAYGTYASHFTSIRNEATDEFRYYKYSNEYVPGNTWASGAGIVYSIAPGSTGQILDCAGKKVWDSPTNPDPSIVDAENPCDNLSERYFLLTKHRVPNARGVSDEFTVPINLYPNPATGSVQIKGLSGESVSAIILVDMLGRSKSSPFEQASEGMRILLPTVSGLYTVTVVLKDGSTQSLGRLCVR